MVPLEHVLQAGRAPRRGEGVPGASVARAGEQGLLHADVAVPSPACIVLAGPWAFPAVVFEVKTCLEGRSQHP